jgi:manganese transport protein
LLLHEQDDLDPIIEKPLYNKIAVALDFSSIDAQVLQHALAMGKKHTQFLLIHVVESVPAIYFGKDSEDYETLKDAEVLQKYAAKIHALGFMVETQIGYGNPKNAIPEIVIDFNADILVVGSHGHKFLMDILYGTIIDSVRHQLKIPVLIVQ